MMSGKLFSCLTHIQLLQIISAETDSIAANHYIRDGETIISSGEMFELGIFSPGNSKNRYLGIWYYKISPQTVVWVANRDIPLTNASGVFKLSSDGVLLLLSGVDNVWSSNSSVSAGNINPVAQLLDTGNFVVTNESNIDHSSVIWESFDYPGDTMLPGMKFGKDFVSGTERRLTSWKSVDDPSTRLYVNYIDTNGYPQAFQRRGSVIQHRFGPWNGIRFSGFPSLIQNSRYKNVFVFNQKEAYIKYEFANTSFRSRVYLSPEGNEVRLNWIDPTQGWIPYLATTLDICAHHGLCGPNGICSVNNSPSCSCIIGFEPLQPEEWNIGNWTSGCQRKNPLGCVNGDDFQKFSGVKVPDTRRSWYNVSMSLAECEIACDRKCSCTAYANLDIQTGGTGCLLWFGDLMDIRVLEENQDIYIKIAMTEPTEEGLSILKSGSSKKRVVIMVVLTLVGAVLVGLPLGVYAYKKKISQRPGNATRHYSALQMERENVYRYN